MINGHEVYGGSPPFTELSEQQQNNLVGVVKEIVESQAHVEDANTNPGFVVLSTKPSCELYRKAVTTLVALEEVLAILKDHHAVYEGYKNKRGLIGATAAVSWEPGDRTYEIITYRPRERWGTKRQVDARSVQQMDMKCTGTFDNYDTLNRHNRLVPASPCPILYGIRGENPEELRLAVELVKSEPMESWLLFETNQGTDDHLMRKSIVQVQSFESVIVQGTVVEPAKTIPGGHVLFRIRDATGTIDCAAYEPTKEFRQIIRKLSTDDIVEVFGGVREQPLTINLEKIRVIQLASLIRKVENPVCPTCGKHMKSKGTNQGFKCRKCKTSSIEPVLQHTHRSLTPGMYEVPICARRHLSKPLKRMGLPSVVTAIGTGDIP